MSTCDGDAYSLIEIGRGEMVGEMVDFVKWALTDGQKLAGALGYAPLPDEVVKLEMAALQKVKVS